MAFAIAWITALALSWWVYRRSAVPAQKAVTRVVAAAKTLPLGHKLTASDVKLIALEQGDVPAGSFQQVEDVAGRALITPVSAGELILNARLAAKDGGEGLTAVIEPGMRAVAVQVNEVSSVAGFIQPGTRVDVLYTRAFADGGSATRTLLQNIKVIALGRQISAAPASSEAQAAAAARDARAATVATLMVTQQQGEMLTLAMQRGKIQLALRNPLDSEVAEDADPTMAEDLGIKEPVRAGVRPAPATDQEMASRGGRPGARRPASDEVVVKVFRGNKLTEETFVTTPARPTAR